MKVEEITTNMQVFFNGCWCDVEETSHETPRIQVGLHTDVPRPTTYLHIRYEGHKRTLKRPDGYPMMVKPKGTPNG